MRATVNDDAMGDIIGDINRRRGRVLGMNPTGDGIQEIIAEVPEAEMSTFSTSMRQITQGRGSFTTEFARYERVPEHIAQKVIAPCFIYINILAYLYYFVKYSSHFFTDV